jgi:hypothetical protein
LAPDTKLKNAKFAKFFIYPQKIAVFVALIPAEIVGAPSVGRLCLRS